MSGKQALHLMAKRDTPEIVEVPETWPGIIAWLIGRFGVGVLGFGLLYIVYQDFMATHKDFYKDIKARDERIVAAFEKSVNAQSESNSILKLIEHNQKEINDTISHHGNLLEEIGKNQKN